MKKKADLLLIQRYFFCAFAIAASLVSHFFPNLGTSLIVFIVIILGVPHGALDTLFARELFNFEQLSAWFKFILVYSLIALSVVGFWLWSSFVFLLLFLLISIWHFSDDLIAGTPKIIRLIYGGTIITLPSIFFSSELIKLLSYLTEPSNALKIVAIISSLAIPWLILIGLALIYLSFRSRSTFIELACLAILATFSHPLFAFSIYFCLMHSTRHIIRTLKFLEKSSKKSILLAAVLPTLAVFLIWALLFKSLSMEMIDANLIQIVFVTLAALTVPHMLMLEKSGFRRWIQS